MSQSQHDDTMKGILADLRPSPWACLYKNFPALKSGDYLKAKIVRRTAG
jgi:hypothetical protein